MDEARARTLLESERAEVESMLTAITRSGTQDREAGQETGDSVDTAQPLESEGVDDAVESSLRERLAAIERAEQRLADGTFGLSVLSGEPIPDARLEAAPTAELTIEESARRP
jgi:RNA polymerase-binding transcription factor